MDDWLTCSWSAFPCTDWDIWVVKLNFWWRRDLKRRLFQHLSLLSDILCAFSAEDCNELVSLLAKPDHLGYFHLLERLCRMAPWDNWGKGSSSILPRKADSFKVLYLVYTLLHSAGAASAQADQDKQQQRPWWQLRRAAASTYASWTKAYTKTLRAVASGRVTTSKQTAAAGGSAQQSEEEKRAAQDAAAAEGAARGGGNSWVGSKSSRQGASRSLECAVQGVFASWLGYHQPHGCWC